MASSQDSMSSAEKAQAYARLLAGDKKPERLGKRKQPVKSNLESFKEELRQYDFNRAVYICVYGNCLFLEFKRKEKKGTNIRGH